MLLEAAVSCGYGACQEAGVRTVTRRLRNDWTLGVDATASPAMKSAFKQMYTCTCTVYWETFALQKFRE